MPHSTGVSFTEALSGTSADLLEREGLRRGRRDPGEQQRDRDRGRDDRRGRREGDGDASATPRATAVLEPHQVEQLRRRPGLRRPFEEGVRVSVEQRVVEQRLGAVWRPSRASSPGIEANSATAARQSSHCSRCFSYSRRSAGESAPST